MRRLKAADVDALRLLASAVGRLRAVMQPGKVGLAAVRIAASPGRQRSGWVVAPRRQPGRAPQPGCFAALTDLRPSPSRGH